MNARVMNTYSLRKCFYAILLLFVTSAYAFSQDKVVHLSDSMFDETKGTLVLSLLDGWVFNAEHNMDFVSETLNTDDWTKLKPAYLSRDHADEHGVAAGWFRIKIQLDSSLNAGSLGVMNSTWKAVDLYINGLKVKSFGNTGDGVEPFSENKAMLKVASPVSLRPDSVYTIAIRVVDAAPMSSEIVKSKTADDTFYRVLILTNEDYNVYNTSEWIDTAFYFGLTISITTVLSLLFWFIYLLNRKEKNIRHFAVSSTLLAILPVIMALMVREEITYYAYLIYSAIFLITIMAFLIYVPFILVAVFGRAISRLNKVFLVSAVIVLVLGLFTQNQVLSIAGGAISLIVTLYYLFSSLKSLNRSRWAIVTGLLLSMVFMIIYFVRSYDDPEQAMIYAMLSILCPPTGMLVYVAFRFKEMIEEVQTNSAQVIQLSEEKREQALSEKQRLEEEVEKRTADLRNTLSRLKAAQAQLVQSEKMASLGELTAGIAHEIKNPLNFVNNFSEVSMELLDEMKTELDTGNTDEAKEIAHDVMQNLGKIVHHGKRADNIVKGMLQHSRSSTGQKEPTDVNALVDEYLRLAYHGLRAKDKTFNATLKTDYDESLGKLDIMPQDMGRVILNLVTNAFYAVADKKKTAGDAFFAPTVSVRTTLDKNRAFIAVADNGNGIPEQIKEKIFQPFFTTKPTGEGTGLGLSLAYDIVKAHGGDLSVQTIVGEGTTFTVSLPIR